MSKLTGGMIPCKLKPNTGLVGKAVKNGEELLNTFNGKAVNTVIVIKDIDDRHCLCGYWDREGILAKSTLKRMDK